MLVQASSNQGDTYANTPLTFRPGLCTLVVSQNVGWEPTEEMRSVEEVLRESKVIAVVGLSPRPERDSHRVARYLQEHGYRVIPVNPLADRILEEQCYPDLLSIPQRADVVNIFRRPEWVPAIVDEAIQIGASLVWMQLGIVHHEAAAKARSRGLEVIMDRCMLTEHRAMVAQGTLG